MKKSVRRIISSVLCLALLIATVPTFVFAAGTAAITIDGSSYSAGVDVSSVTSITLPIKVEATNVNVADWKLTYDSNVFESASVSLATGIAGNVELKNAAIWWEADDLQNISGNFINLTLTVKADAELGDTTVSVAGTMTDDDYEDIDVSASTTLTLTDGSPTVAGYTAALSTSAANNEVVSEGNITVNVGVSHSSDTVFNAGEIVLEYDSSKLTLDTTSLGDLKYTNENGKLTIEDFGGDKSFANDNYAIKFNAASVDTDTTTEVKLTSAAFVHKANANTSDLIAATNVPLSLNVTIKVAMINVTLTNTTDSSSTTESIPKGQDYTFAPEDTANYQYTDVKATVGDQEIELTDNGDGTFTLGAEYVTGDFTVTYERNPKSYNVEWTGDGAGDVTNKPTSATYGTPLTISIPADFEATQDQAGARYTATVSIGSEVVQNLSGGESYTIEGSAITDIITINVDKEVIPSLGSDDITITVTGDAGVTIQGADGNSITIDPDTDVTLILTEEPGYSYSVVDDSGNSVTFTDGEYTFTATETVTFTVTKTLDVSSVTITEYVKVDEYVVYLVTYDGTLVAGKVPTYDGNVMFWSEKYDAYCWLVIDGTLTEEAAKAKVEAKTASAPEVDYGMDINGTGVTDAADAQLVWNMYNAMYSDFTDVTMAKFLNADQNATETANWGLNVQDALVIIEAILAGNATS